MKNRILIAWLLVLALALTGCGEGAGTETTGSGWKEAETTGETEDTANNSSAVGTAVDTSDMFSDRDYRTEYDESKSAVIQLSGDTAACSSDAVQISGSTVTITDEGTYILRGTLEDGMIIVNADENDKLQLVLDGVSVTSAASAPLYILEADKVFLTLPEGTENVLSNGGSFEAIDNNNIDGAVFSKQDLTINGTGSLEVISPAGNGIVCKDDLVLTGGRVAVNCASDGLEANDSVRIINSVLTVTAGKDGIHSENEEDTALGFVYISDGTLEISAEGDGISAGGYMQITGGSFDLLTGGGSENGNKQTSDSWGGMGGFPGGMGGGRPRGGGGWMGSATTETAEDSTKGLKAAGDLTVSGGSFTIDSADDAVHSNSSITVSGGEFEIATGDDGFHADDTLTITGGSIRVTESYEGLEGLHVAVSGGEIQLVCSDDGVNAAGGTDSSGFGGIRGDQFGGRGGMGGMGGSSDGSIVISGGDLYVNASGDGLDANGTLEISGGYTVVVGPTQGDTATLDYDVSAVITGGTFLGTGASGMAQTFSDSEQGVFAVNVGNQPAGSEFVLTDADGEVVVRYTPELSYAVVIVSTPEMVKGNSYTLTIGSNSGTLEAS